MLHQHFDFWTFWHLAAATNRVQDDGPGSRGHPTISGKPELKELTSALNKVASEWKRLGVNLGIPTETLDTIAADHPHSSQNCLLEMLNQWLKQQLDPPSWGNIIDAVESLGDWQLGRELRQRYGIWYLKNKCKGIASSNNKPPC